MDDLEAMKSSSIQSAAHRSPNQLIGELDVLGAARRRLARPPGAKSGPRLLRKIRQRISLNIIGRVECPPPADDLLVPNQIPALVVACCQVLFRGVSGCSDNHDFVYSVFRAALW